MAREHWIECNAAYDRSDPDPKKSYGVHGVDMRWYVRGPEGAVQFVVYTNWHLPHVQERLDARDGSKFPHVLCHPLPADIGYHARTAQYDGQTPITPDEPCPLIGVPCYYDGSGLHAEKVFRILIEQGGDALWAYLDNYYNETFGLPDPARAGLGDSEPGGG